MVIKCGRVAGIDHEAHVENVIVKNKTAEGLMHDRTGMNQASHLHTGVQSHEHETGKGDNVHIGVMVKIKGQLVESPHPVRGEPRQNDVNDHVPVP